MIYLVDPDKLAEFIADPNTIVVRWEIEGQPPSSLKLVMNVNGVAQVWQCGPIVEPDEWNRNADAVESNLILHGIVSNASIPRLPD